MPYIIKHKSSTVPLLIAKSGTVSKAVLHFLRSHGIPRVLLFEKEPVFNQLNSGQFIELIS